jgi:hypothetical protein
MHIIFPQRNPLVPLIEVSNGTFTFGDSHERLSLSNEQKSWLNNLSGDKSIDDALATHSNEEDRQFLRQVVRAGLESAGILDSHAQPVITRWTSEKKKVGSEITHLHIQEAGKCERPNPADTIDRRCNSQIYIAGTNYLSANITSLLQQAGFIQAASVRTASVVVFPSISHSLVADHDFAERERLPHLHVGIRHTKAVVGPLVIPGLTSCIRCDFLHRRDQDPTWPARYLAWRSSQNHSTADSLLLHMTSAFTVSILRQWVDGNRPWNSAWVAAMPLPSFARENRPPHPLCGCQFPVTYPDERT